MWGEDTAPSAKLFQQTRELGSVEKGFNITRITFVMAGSICCLLVRPGISWEQNVVGIMCSSFSWLKESLPWRNLCNSFNIVSLYWNVTHNEKSENYVHMSLYIIEWSTSVLFGQFGNSDTEMNSLLSTKQSWPIGLKWYLNRISIFHTKCKRSKRITHEQYQYQSVVVIMTAMYREKSVGVVGWAKNKICMSQCSVLAELKCPRAWLLLSRIPCWHIFNGHTG